MASILFGSCGFTSLLIIPNRAPNSAELKSLGPDFVFGFVQAVDGERDPRNLLLAFQIARNIIHRGYDFSEYSLEDTDTTRAPSNSLWL